MGGREMIDRDPPRPLDRAPAAKGSRLLGGWIERAAAGATEPSRSATGVSSAQHTSRRSAGRCREREASVSAESGAGDVEISNHGFELLESLEPA